MTNRHIGSDFDDFLKEEGIHAEAEVAAVKRVVAHQIEAAMKRKEISKATLARKMKTSRSALERLLDEHNTAVTLQTLCRAASALGGRLKVQMA
jgi:DNA-binding Xre family transcriptional regulator